MHRFTLKADTLVGFHLVVVGHGDLGLENDGLVRHVLDRNERGRLPFVHVHAEENAVDWVDSHKLLPVGRV